MAEAKWDLIIRLDEGDRCFRFFLSRVGTDRGVPRDNFSVEISFDDLKERGGDGAENLMGKSVLGFFDQLTNGRLDIPRHYLEE
jgi:hypothetical protein